MRRMKDSGIEWIGEIPEEWGVEEIKYLFDIYSGTTPKSTDIDYWDGSIVWITPADFETKDVYISDSRKKITEMGKISSGLKITPPNSIIFSKRAPVGKVAVNTVPLCTNQGCFSCVPKQDLATKYFYYVMSSCTAEFELYSAGSTFKEISADLFKSRKFPVPEAYARKRIVDYLDRKCAEIDAVIARQEAMIEKLKEYKLSLITEAVTRGLDPDAPMKDSGVEWIGQIPEHWKVVKFGRCAMVVSNLVSPDRSEDYPQIAPDCIEKNSAKLLEVRTVRESGVISWNHLFHKGQIIYSKVRPLLNKVIIAPFDGLCSADMYPIETEENNKFLLYCILSRCFSEQVALVTMDRVKMPKINQNELSNIWMALPPTHEQREIVEYLDGKCDAIDNAVMKKQSLIDLLTSYKKSLIYEVVTGKREVPA